MWSQNYSPVGGSLALSALVAAIPIFTLLFLLGIRRKPAWMAGLSGLAATFVVSLVFYRMPVGKAVAAASYGAAFGLFPIGWIVFWAVLLYRITVETGKFDVIKASVGNLTSDRRLQALLIAFAFGAFLEGAAGFGTPVAVAAAMLTGLGFSPFYAAGICLLANTAPVAFGSIGIPTITLGAITGLPVDRLSAGIGRICAPVSLFIPAYLVMVMGGWRALRGVLPAAVVCGVSFAGMQFLISNFVGPQLTDLASSLAAILSLVILFLVWKPKDAYQARGMNANEDEAKAVGPRPSSSGGTAVFPAVAPFTFLDVLVGWSPYLLLVACVLLWGWTRMQTPLNSVTIPIPWPALHNQILKMPPVSASASPYTAVFTFNWLSASGTACMIATLLSAIVLRLSPKRFGRLFIATVRQLGLSLLTLAAVLGLAFLMNYSGATGTLGLMFAATGTLFPFFSAILGWMGVFLTGSDTSANALFGNLQVVTASKLGLNPVLMAASNSSGGVMGKMISLSSIAVAAAATGMPCDDEARLFRFTLKHSIFMAAVVGGIVVLYASVLRHLAP